MRKLLLQWALKLASQTVQAPGLRVDCRKDLDVKIQHRTLKPGHDRIVVDMYDPTKVGRRRRRRPATA